MFTSEINTSKIVKGAGIFLALWLSVKYLLPLIMPFLVGGGIALAAEPAVSFGQRKLKLSRGAATGLGVTTTFLILLALLSIAGMFLVRELGSVAGAMPDLAESARQGMLVLQDYLVGMTEKTPEGVRPVLTRSVLNFFDDGTALVEQVAKRIPAMVSSVISWVPDGALGIGAGVLSSFLISARLPKIRRLLAKRLPQSWNEKYLPALQRIKKAMGGWFKAQGKLALITYIIVGLGFLILKIPYGLAWAALVAVVDAVPMLGTGTALIPFAVVSMLQGQYFRGAGLICIFLAAMFTRTILEPRLVGRQLGLDPLVTLLFLYLGYRFWGILGMIIAPILATAAASAISSGEKASQ